MTEVMSWAWCVLCVSSAGLVFMLATLWNTGDHCDHDGEDDRWN